MNGLIQDPSDPSQWLLRDMVLRAVHSPVLCSGRFCVVHNPSEHHMRSWFLNWRDDKGIFERLCPHRIGHPDPDQLAYFHELGLESLAVHGCDGCCQTPVTG
jgi:hypothetical protein